MLATGHATGIANNNVDGVQPQPHPQPKQHDGATGMDVVQPHGQRH